MMMIGRIIVKNQMAAAKAIAINRRSLSGGKLLKNQIFLSVHFLTTIGFFLILIIPSLSFK
jgi:hypothetical protein